MREPGEKVFLSYARPDREPAQQLAGQLRKAGFQIWDPEIEILPGDDWTDALRNALETADAMVVFISDDSMNSREVSLEISYALGAKHLDGRLIPVLLGSAKGAPWIFERLQVIRFVDPEKSGQEVVEALRRPVDPTRPHRRESRQHAAETKHRAG